MEPDMKKTFIWLAVLLSGFNFGMAEAQEANRKSVVYFGIVPQQSATKLAQVWVPVLQEISARSGLDVRFVTAKDIPAFEACLLAGAYDAAYMNPYHYVFYHAKSGYQAIAHRRDAKLQGIIVTRTDSAITALEQLSGKDVAFPSPAAFGASVLPRAEMTQKNIPFTPHYVKSHDSVYRAVAAGHMPAGGGIRRTFDNMPEDIRSQLQILHTTLAYTPHAIAVSSRLDKASADRLQDALTGIGEGSPVFKGLGIKGFEAAEDSAWDDIRDLNLGISATEIINKATGACHSG